MVTDHGFRVPSTDPLFYPINGLTWPNQANKWRLSPSGIAAAGMNPPQNFVARRPWLRRRDLEGSQEDIQDIGFNTTLYNETTLAKLPLRRTGTQFFLEDEDSELCHRLNMKMDEQELQAYGDDVKEFCANALTTDISVSNTASPMETVVDTPSRNTLSLLEPTSTLVAQIATRMMTMTMTGAAPVGQTTGL